MSSQPRGRDQDQLRGGASVHTQARDGQAHWPLTWAAASTAAHAAVLAAYLPLAVLSRATAAALRLAWRGPAEHVATTAAAVVAPRKPVVATPHAHQGFQRRSMRVSSAGHETDTLAIGDPALAQLTVVCVPGNPGNALFYAPFMRRLYELGE
jgi:hypothetical protein